MTRFIVLGVALAGTGCVHIQPVGPFADWKTPPVGTKAGPADVATPEPVVKEGPKPVPPALYVTPGEITAANADEAVKRLAQELETDRRSMEAMPKYAEVSGPKR